MVSEALTSIKSGHTVWARQGRNKTVRLHKDTWDQNPKPKETTSTESLLVDAGQLEGTGSCLGGNRVPNLNPGSVESCLSIAAWCQRSTTRDTGNKDDPLGEDDPESDYDSLKLWVIGVHSLLNTDLHSLRSRDIQSQQSLDLYQPTKHESI